MADDEIKKLILARRAQFIAAAVAGFVACEPGPEAPPPSICLSISVMPPDDAAAGPTIVDAGVSIDPDAAWANDATVATEPDSDAPPQPCLAPPMPCLSVAPPPPRQLDAGGPPPRPCLSPKPPRPPPTASTQPPPPRVCLSFSGPDD